MSVTVVNACEAGQLDAVHGGWDQQYVQCSPGPFKGSIAYIELAGVTLFEERINTRIEQTFRPPSNTLVFSFDTAAKNLYVLDHSLPSAWITPENYHEVSLVFRQNPAQSGCMDSLRGLVMKPLKSPQSGLFASWLTHQMASMTATNVSVPMLASQLLEDCLYVIENAHCQLPEPTLNRDRKNRSVVQRCNELVDKCGYDDLSSVDLANSLGVSVLQLTKAFRNYLGLSPTAWLRLRRLNLAHRDLLNANAEDTTVAEVAMRYSFWHLGRFAMIYRQLFAEQPRATLRRKR